MAGLKQLIQEIHRRSLWQVLAIYVAVSWAVIEAADVIVARFSLPEWVYGAAIMLLLVGLPIVVATAFVQEGFTTKSRHDPTLLPAEERSGRGQATGPRRLLTWRNAILGGVLAFALWGVVATGLLIFGESRGDRDGPDNGERKSIAVIPFANMSDDPDNEYFSDGITDDIITHLSMIADLKVISRQSSMQYKGSPKSLRQIGEELSVATVLEGGVQRIGDRVRINAQLIDAESDEHIWVEQYDRDLTDVFAIQSDVAQQIAAALRATFSTAEKKQIEEKPTENLEAYDFYLRGSDYFRRSRDEAEFRIALRMYETAVELDPRFALAHAKLSRVHEGMYWFFYDRTEERLASAKQAAERALQLRPELGDAHVAMGWYYYHGEYDYDRALASFSVAERKNPSDPELFNGIAAVQRRLGEWDLAAANFKKALELNPRSPILTGELSGTYRRRRDYTQAARYADRTMSLAPDQYRSYMLRAFVYISAEGNTEAAHQVIERAWSRINPVPLSVGNEPWRWSIYRLIDRDYERTLNRLASGSFEADSAAYFITIAELNDLAGQPERASAYHDSARAILERTVAARPNDARFHSELGIAYAGLGRNDEAIREGERAVKLLPVTKDAYDGTDWVTYLARIYVMVGEYDNALRQLEYLLSVPSPLSVHWLRVDPIWDPLRSHPRFQALLKKYE